MLIRNLLRMFGHQKWIRFGIRDRIIRAFDNVDKQSNKFFSVPFFGKTYVGDLSVFIDWSTYYYGSYESEELNLMRDALNGVSDPIIIDVGANVGHHSLFASTFAKEVHAFEPFPDVSAKIYDKIKVNSIKNIKVHEVGLGDTNEDLFYYTPGSHNTGVGYFSAEPINGSAYINLPVRIGDEYLKPYNLPKVDFIKIDVEGYEPQAIRGLKQTIHLYRPIIFFEWSYNERHPDINETHRSHEFKLLFPSNYTIYNIISNEPYLKFFSKKGYTLIEDIPPINDGNKIAIPNEKVSNFSNIKHN